MRTIWQWASLCVLSVAIQSASSRASAQTPVIQGTSVSDSAIPTVISPSAQGSGFFVLNQDLSLLTHSTVDSSFNGTCAAPNNFSASSTTPRTFLNDTQNAYFTAASSTGANAAVSGFSFINTGLCQPINGPAIAGGVATYRMTSNDTFHARYYVLSGFNGNGADTLTVEVNLNNALSGGNYVTQLKSVPLDTGAQYTSMVTDTLAGASGYGLTAITELKTATSPGNLWIYNQSSGAAYKILGPGGVALPAVGSFLIPAPTNAGGALLVLVNQDNLTTSNLSNPPLDTKPFTIIDLGQLIQTFSVQTTGGTITLPFVTQISATTPYFAMLGAAYNPVTRLVYAVVGGGSLTAVTGHVVSYDPFHPGSPNETVVADVSSIPFSYGAYPQLALSAAAGTLQILTSSPTGLYSVGILGTGNVAAAVTGPVFPDSNFNPTYIAANPLLGETYIASTSGQVDILRNSAAKPLATFTINGPDIATTTQTYSLQATALVPVVDAALRAAPVTITATNASTQSSFTVAAGTFSNFGLNPSNISINFPALGTYTLVASIPATANFPAMTSNAVNVTVASNFIAGVYPTTLAIAGPATSATTAGNVLVNLSGSTYAPTGHIDVKDGTGTVVGTTYFNGGALVQPTTVAVTLAQGTNTLTAVYSGDAQNAASTSPSFQVTVGAATVASTLTVTAPATAAVNGVFSVNIKLASAASTQTPSGTINVSAQLAGATTSTIIGSVNASQAYATGGNSFNANFPTAGVWTITASYAGDANFNASSNTAVVTINASTTVATTLKIVAPASVAINTPYTAVVTLSGASSLTSGPSGLVTIVVTSPLGAVVSTINTTAASAFLGNGYSASIPAAATAGTYTLTASYAGDSNYAASSTTSSVTVGGSSIGTTLGVSAASNVFTNASFVTTVTLKATGSSTATITGNVTLMATGYGGTVNSYALGTVSASAALASGGAQVSGSIPAAGTYTLAAVYSGDTNYSASNGSVLIAVAQPTTTVGLSAVANQYAGFAFPVTVRLSSQTGAGGTPTGNVVLSTLVGTTTTTLATVTAAQALTSGGYQAQVTLPGAGNFTITATYSGDTNFAGSSGKLTVASTLIAPSLQLTGPATGYTGTSTSYGVALFGFSGNPTVTTTVTSTLNGVAGPTATFNTTGSTVSLNFTTVGTYTVTASFPGDALNAPAISNTITTVVATQSAAPSYTLTLETTATTPAQAIPYPNHGYTDYDFILTTTNGFSDTVNLYALFVGAGVGTDVTYRITDQNGVILPGSNGISNSVPVKLGAAPLNLKIRLYGGNATVAGVQMPGRSARNTAFAGLFVGLLLFARARRRLSATMSKLIVAILVIGSAGVVLSGCVNSYLDPYVVNLTAQPANSTAAGGAPQTVTFYAYEK